MKRTPQLSSDFLALLLDPKTSPVDARPAKRPSLTEAIEMFAELKQYNGRMIGRARYVLFAISNPAKEANEKQDKAIAQLKQFASDLKIRVIEVRLE